MGPKDCKRRSVSASVSTGSVRCKGAQTRQSSRAHLQQHRERRNRLQKRRHVREAVRRDRAAADGVAYAEPSCQLWSVEAFTTALADA